MILMILPNYDTEDALTKRLQQKDKVAMHDIYEQYFPPVYHYIRLKINNAHAAEDLAGDVFLALIEAVHNNTAPRTSLRGWLFKVARNLIAQYYETTHKIHEANLEEWISIDNDSLENIVIENADFNRLIKALHTLPTEHQEVIIFRFGQSLNLKETADIMGKRVPAIKSLQFRAIQNLRHALQGEK